MGLFDFLTGGSQAASKAAEQNRQLYQGYENKGIGALDTAYGTSKGYLDENRSTFDDLAGLGTKYGGATNLLLGGLGAGTDADRTAAYDAFRAQPGQQYAIDQASDAAARKGNALGVGTGNIIDSVRSTAQNVADQQWGSYLDRLAGFISPEVQTTAGAASGRSANLGALSGLSQQDATNRINVYGNSTGGQAKANTDEANAKLQEQNNFWNLLGNLGGGILKLGMAK